MPSDQYSSAEEHKNKKNAVTDQLLNFASIIEDLPESFDQVRKQQIEELDTHKLVRKTIEDNLPGIDERIRQLEMSIQLLSGKQNMETLQVLLARPTITQTLNREIEPKKEKKTKAFIRRKSEIITDYVVEKIAEYIGSDETYKKAKDIYEYLIINGHIKKEDFGGDLPHRTFSIGLSRVDQNLIKYNDHYGVMAWGLLDFGSPEHARRKALKNTLRQTNPPGTRIASFRPEEAIKNGVENIRV